MSALTPSQIAERYGVSRQRVHAWLRSKRLLDQCQAIAGPSGEKTALLMIPEQLIATAPFVTEAKRRRSS